MTRNPIEARNGRLAALVTSLILWTAAIWCVASAMGCASTPESRVFVKDGQLCSEIVVLPEDAE